MKNFKYIISAIGVIGIIFGVAFISTGSTYLLESFWSPKFQNLNREIFENTKSYNKGKVAELAKYYDEYRRAETPEDKQTIKQLVKISFVDYDASKIQEYALQNFVRECRGY